MIGTISEKLTDVIFETLPLEISILDHDDKVLAWNKHETRVFKRPKGVVGRDVRNCHPQKSLSKVERILHEMKQGTRDKATFWIDLPLDETKKKHKIMIQYLALRDSEGTYLGCLEATQDITEIKTIEGEKRLLDEK
jgi:PAS domain S-box-containing protein